jgi:hypothetical protein
MTGQDHSGMTKQDLPPGYALVLVAALSIGLWSAIAYGIWHIL